MDIAEIDRDSPTWDPLWTLFGGYLHQDFAHEYASAWAAISAYRSDNSPAEVGSAAAAARRLVAGVADDDALGQAVDKLGLDYYPPGDGYTYREWLLELAAVLEAP